MAIATNFSKEFYDKLGHEVVEEMVNWFNQTDVEYRTQLRDLNDRNYSRFEAKLEQRFSEQDAKWERRQNDQFSRLLKWMFVFWSTSLVSMIGLSIAIVQLLQ
jgi:hypothetical protein